MSIDRIIFLASCVGLLWMFSTSATWEQPECKPPQQAKARVQL